MTTKEHLTKIKEKCEQLLELATKRTPGKWLDKTQFVAQLDERTGGYSVKVCGTNYQKDTSFIASCAGPAEAGWRATIAAIAGFQRLSKWNFTGWEGDCGIIAEIEGEIDAILAAWPEELL